MCALKGKLQSIIMERTSQLQARTEHSKSASDREPTGKVLLRQYDSAGHGSKLRPSKWIKHEKDLWQNYANIITRNGTLKRGPPQKLKRVSRSVFRLRQTTHVEEETTAGERGHGEGQYRAVVLDYTQVRNWGRELGEGERHGAVLPGPECERDPHHVRDGLRQK